MREVARIFGVTKQRVSQVVASRGWEGAITYFRDRNPL
jgi:hypothetical protein